MISENTVNLVREIPIFDVINRFVNLKKAGALYECPCPIHGGKDSNFKVDPRNGKNSWFCYSQCSRGGDTIQFIIEVCGLEFQEAVIKLAEDHNITLEYEKGENAQKYQEKREHNKQAKHYLHKLWEKYQAANCAASLKYFESRGFTKENVEYFGYGFAPKGCAFAQEVFRENPKLGRDLGYIKDGEDNSQYDYFRNRIIVPIQNRMGEVIAFAGRVLDSSEPKWINAASAPGVYEKNQVVYGLHRAAKAIRKTKECRLSEGYFDVDYAHLKGIENIVAACGTSITPEQLKCLQKEGTELTIFIPDKDAITEEDEQKGKTQATTAGNLSVLRAIDKASEIGLYSQVIDLPQPNIREKVDLHSFLLQPGAATA